MLVATARHAADVKQGGKALQRESRFSFFRRTRWSCCDARGYLAHLPLRSPALSVFARSSLNAGK